MAHKVFFTIPERQLGKADIVYTVFRDGSKLGELRVSKGAVVWLPSGRQYGYKVNWARFDDVMRDNGAEVRPG